VGLRQRTRRKRFGLPEVVALALTIVVGHFALRLWRTNDLSGWPQAPGWVTTCSIRKTHYNAEPSGDKVCLTYEYDVAGQTYIGSWTGYWPRAHSPNALPDGNVAVLKAEKYPLLVLYNPYDHAQNRLHNPDPDQRIVFTVLTFGAGVLLLFYCVKLYPAWRARLAP